MSDLEGGRMILVGRNFATELTAQSPAGNDLLNGVSTVLRAGINGGLILARVVPLFVTITAEHTLELATAAYKAHPDNPERLSDFNQAFWYAARIRMGVAQSDLVVGQCPYNEHQIRQFMGFGRRLGRSSRPTDFGLFVPQIVSTAPEGLILLGRAYSEVMRSRVFQGTTVLNVDNDGQPINLYGWMRTEERMDVPYTGTNQDQAERIVEKRNRVGQTLNVYAVAGQQSRLLTGQYLDERTWVRILSSRIRSRVVSASFRGGDRCNVGQSLSRTHVNGSLGVRSVELS